MELKVQLVNYFNGSVSILHVPNTVAGLICVEMIKLLTYVSACFHCSSYLHAYIMHTNKQKNTSKRSLLLDLI